MDKNKTTLGIEENFEGALCYILGWISGIIFLLLEKENDFVRFHAMQSLLVFLGLFVISVVIGWIPLIGWLISLLILPVGFILWLVLIYKAYQGKRFKLPFIGDFAEQQIFEEEDTETNDDNI